ncbi:MAG TPA: tetratricopeptide repeat protein [Blastocatellia bacterium]|nr:tetratricopeptide repeat protein [Blastocatellia bacterium]
MFKKILTHFAIMAAAAAITTITAFGQAGVTALEGQVKMKADGGALKPVVGATVDIWRTDIRGHWDAKTDKNGHYIRLGLDYVGVYIIAVSGPGLSPSWVNNVHPASSSVVDIEVNAGDGSRLTLEDVQKQIAAQKGGGLVQPSMSAADRAKAEAANKANAETAAKNEELKSTYKGALDHFKQGVALKQAKDLPGALAEFKQAAAIDATKQAAFAEVAYKSNANAALVDSDLGVEAFNQKKRDEAKPHFEGAVAQVNKAISIVNADPEKEKPAVKADLITYYDILAKNVRILVEHYGEANLIDDTVKAFDQVEALDLPANKNKWEVDKGDLYRLSGKGDEAAAAYKTVLTTDPNNLDALYGIGLTLIASPDKAVIQQAANYLADFISKAPATDRRVPDVKSALDALKAVNNVEAEKPSKRKKG